MIPQNALTVIAHHQGTKLYTSFKLRCISEGYSHTLSIHLIVAERI